MLTSIKAEKNRGVLVGGENQFEGTLSEMICGMEITL